MAVFILVTAAGVAFLMGPAQVTVVIVGFSFFITSFAIGVGGTGWLIQGEVFPPPCAAAPRPSAPRRLDGQLRVRAAVPDAEHAFGLASVMVLLAVLPCSPSGSSPSSCPKPRASPWTRSPTPSTSRPRQPTTQRPDMGPVCHPCRSGAGQPPVVGGWSIVLRPPRGCGRVGVGGGVKERPEGARVSGRRSLRPSPVGARYGRRRISSDQRVAPVALVGVGSRATPVRVSPGGWTGPGGGVGHPFAAPVVGGMVCCDGSARAGSIKWGDHAEPGSGIMTNNDPRPPRGRVAHAARARAGRQRRW